MYVLVVVVYLVVSFIEIFFLYKKQQKKEIIFFSVVMAFSFVISILLLAGVDLPKPINMIEKLLSGVSKK